MLGLGVRFLRLGIGLLGGTGLLGGRNGGALLLVVLRAHVVIVGG